MEGVQRPCPQRSLRLWLALERLPLPCRVFLGLGSGLSAAPEAVFLIFTSSEQGSGRVVLQRTGPGSAAACCIASFACAWRNFLRKKYGSAPRPPRVRAGKNETHTGSTPLQGSYGAPLRKNPTPGALEHQRVRADATTSASALKRKNEQSESLRNPVHCSATASSTAASPKRNAPQALHQSTHAQVQQHTCTDVLKAPPGLAYRQGGACFSALVLALQCFWTHALTPPLLDSPLALLAQLSLSPSYQSTGDSPELAHTSSAHYLLSSPRTCAPTHSPSSQ